MTEHFVRCGGATHRIVVGPRGRIAILDHGPLKAELAAAEMGGQAPECVEIVLQIRYGEWGGLPRWTSSLRRPDRESRREKPRIVVRSPESMRWLADRWVREAMPPLLEAAAWCDAVIISFSRGPWAWTYRPTNGELGAVYIDLQPRTAHAALLARLPRIRGRAVLGLDGRQVHYALAEWGRVSCPYAVSVEEWTRWTKGES